MTAPILLIRAFDNEEDAAALASVGLETVIDPYLTIQPVPGQAGLDAAGRLLAKLGLLQRGDWLIATSLNGLRSWGTLAWELTRKSAVADAMAEARQRGVRFAAIGAATAAKFAEFGIHDVFVPSEPYGEALGQQLVAEAAPEAATIGRPIRALVPAGNLAMKTLYQGLAAAGWQVASEVVYETAIVPSKPASAARVAAGEFSAVLLRSPSAARALVHWVTEGADVLPEGLANLPAVCGGRTTAQVAESLGLRVAAIASDTQPLTVANTLKEVVEADTNQGGR
jgi:uroporphyrinogen decarboxylase